MPYRDECWAALASHQNGDGGWGYFAGKKSWLEPTAFACLTLGVAAAPEYRAAADRAFAFLKKQQLASGAYPATPAVREPHGVTALVLTLQALRGDCGDSYWRAVDYLLGIQGAEHDWTLRRLYLMWTGGDKDLDPALTGWPWREGNSSWIEPTTHALVALRKAARRADGKRREAILARIDLAERMMLQRQCGDGGWNFGNKKVLESELFSYPDQTGIALVGLAGSGAVRKGWDSRKSLERAKQLYRPVTPAMTMPSLGAAWLRIGLQNWGQRLDEVQESKRAERLPLDQLVLALEALGQPGGGREQLLPPPPATAKTGVSPQTGGSLDRKVTS